MPEEQAFGLIVKIMYDYGLRELFKPEMVALKLLFYQLDKLIESDLPELHAHFAKYGVEPEMYASQWFLTMYAAKFSLPVAFSIMDLFLLNGMETLLRVAMALLSLNQMDLIVGDFEHMLNFFRVTLPKKYGDDPSELIEIAMDFSLSTKKLKKYEKDFYAKKSMEELEQDPLHRLTKENERLLETQRRLENENDALAKELVTTRASLTQKLDRIVDEKLQVQQSLTKLRALHESSVRESEETKTRLETELAQLKDLYRTLAKEFDEDKSRAKQEVNELKLLVRSVAERAEKEVAALREKAQNLETALGATHPLVVDLKYEAQTHVLEKKLSDTEVQFATTKLKLADTVGELEEAKRKISSLQLELSNSQSASSASTSATASSALSNSSSLSSSASSSTMSANSMSPSSSQHSSQGATTTVKSLGTTAVSAFNNLLQKKGWLQNNTSQSNSQNSHNNS